MSTRYALVAGAALLVLLGINLYFWPGELQRSATSFGVGRDGYKAAYDLLSELGLPVSRSYLPVDRVLKNQTLWLVSPALLDRGQTDTNPAEDARELLKWVRSGGTAVVFGEPGSAWKTLGIDRKTSKGSNTSVVAGDYTPKARTIEVSELLYFSDGRDSARVVLRAAHQPFALEMRRGAGRLIAVADDGFLRNANLAHDDASVLVFDLARALGAPAFDERCHGLAAPVSLVSLMADSRAVLPLGLGLLAAALWMGEQRKWPRRMLRDPLEGPQPSIESFVESLGVIYSRSNDSPAVFRAYRSGFIRRLGKQLSPRIELAEDKVIDRLTRDRALAAETRRWLVEGALPVDEKELVAGVRAIESYPKIGR